MNRNIHRARRALAAAARPGTSSPPARRLSSYSVFAALSAAFAANALAAETVGDSLSSLGSSSSGAPIIVTATRQAARSNELLSDVSVITREEIEAAGQSSLPELLGRQPGIEFDANGGAGSTMSLFIRGTNSEHALVMIDGMRINTATMGKASLSRIPLAQIERIEILRGPASSLYGADAIGGVIQIFTREGSGPASFNAEAGYGSYNTTRLSAGVSARNERWKYSFQAAYDETAGYSNKLNANPDKDGFRDSSFSGKLAYQFDADNEVGLNAFSSDGRNQYDGLSKTRDYFIDNSVGSVGLYSRNRLAPAWQSTLRLGHSVDDSTDHTDGIAKNYYRTAQDQVSWQNDIDLPLGRALLAAEWLKQDLSTSGRYDKTGRTISSLLAGWGAANGAHRWQLNARHDDASGQTARSTGAASYGYQFTDAWRAAAAYGTAFKLPTMNDLYANVPGMGVGNPDLKPEYARNCELSLHYDTPQQKASLTWFDNRIDDFIEWAYYSGSTKEPRNIAARITGWTLAWKGNVGPLALRASVDLQDPRNESSDTLLLRRSREHASLGADYQSGRWSFGSELVSSGMRKDSVYDAVAPGKQRVVRLGGYTLLNLNASYRIDRDVSLFVRANNVFDKQYTLVQDYFTPGASVFVGIRYAQK